MAKHNVTDGFVAALSPGSAARLNNKYYETESEVIQACGEALSHEYKAITDAGLTVQFDAPDLAEAWDQINLSLLSKTSAALCVSASTFLMTPSRTFQRNRPACTSAGALGTDHT